MTKRKVKAGVIGVSVLLSIGLMGGCAAQTSYERPKNTASTSANQPTLQTIDTWANTESSFASADQAGQDAAESITSSNVRDKFNELYQTIESNIPALENAAKNGMDSEGEQAAKTVYEAAATLQKLGENNKNNVGEYLYDLGFDAKTAVANAYNGLVANFDVAQAEVTENYDKANQSSDESWEAFAKTL